MPSWTKFPAPQAPTQKTFSPGDLLKYAQPGKTYTTKSGEEALPMGLLYPPNSFFKDTLSKGGDSGGSMFNESDYIPHSKSYTGPPDWLMTTLRNLNTDFTRKAYGDYRGAIDRLEKAPENIEEARGNLVNKYVAGIQQPIQSGINDAIRRAAGGGVVNSSMTQGAVQDVARNFEQQGQQVQRDTNVWAENQLLQNMLNQITARGNFAQTLNSLLAQSRFGESYSDNPAVLLPYLYDSF